jgi:hypothetical protein
VGGSGPGERRGGDEHADTVGDARETAVADRVAAAAAELYGAEPEAFTERRKALAAEAKTAGDKSAATAIAALRKPTRAAWVVNRLARADPGAPARLAALAAALGAAEQAKDGPRLRELSAERGALIDALTTQALAAASVPDPPTTLRDEVAATLTAAMADPETAAEFAAGTLTKAAHWAGFGFGFGSGSGSTVGLASPGGAVAPADEAVSSVGGSSDEPTRARAPGRAPRGATAKRDGPAQAHPSSPSSPSSPARPARPSRPTGAAGRDQDGSRPPAERRADGPPDEVAARRAAQQRRAAEERLKEEEERRAAEQQQRLAREEAERAAARRKNYEDAERTVVSAATATAEAETAEDRLESEVRDLEERLIQARADLAKARLRARHAESAERRARQTLDRLPRP